MIALVIPVVFLWASCKAESFFYKPLNETKATPSGIAAYRSALTLDWLAAEDMRQRELASAFETEAAPPFRSITTDCMGYARPASGKVARLMLELLKNLEGDEGTIVSDLILALVHTKLLIQTSMLEAEPDLESLVKTPGVMMGEPHSTFPRILALCWLAVTDPVTTKKFGWCPINRINKYLKMSKPITIAKQMRTLEPVIARARFIMEGFIQHVTPLNMYQRKLEHNGTPLSKPTHSTQTEITEVIRTRTHHSERTWSLHTARRVHLAMARAGTLVPIAPIIEPESLDMPNHSEDSSTDFGNSLCKIPSFLLATIVIVL